MNAEEFFSAGDTTGGFYGTWNGKKIGVLPFDLHQTDFPLQAELGSKKALLSHGVWDESAKPHFVVPPKFRRFPKRPS